MGTLSQTDNTPTIFTSIVKNNPKVASFIAVLPLIFNVACSTAPKSSVPGGERNFAKLMHMSSLATVNAALKCQAYRGALKINDAKAILLERRAVEWKALIGEQQGDIDKMIEGWKEESKGKEAQAAMKAEYPELSDNEISEKLSAVTDAQWQATATRLKDITQNDIDKIVKDLEKKDKESFDHEEKQAKKEGIDNFTRPLKSKDELRIEAIKNIKAGDAYMGKIRQYSLRGGTLTVVADATHVGKDTAEFTLLIPVAFKHAVTANAGGTRTATATTTVTKTFGIEGIDGVKAGPSNSICDSRILKNVDTGTFIEDGMFQDWENTLAVPLQDPATHNIDKEDALNDLPLKGIRPYSLLAKPYSLGLSNTKLKFKAGFDIKWEYNAGAKGSIIHGPDAKDAPTFGPGIKLVNNQNAKNSAEVEWQHLAPNKGDDRRFYYTYSDSDGGTYTIESSYVAKDHRDHFPNDATIRSIEPSKTVFQIMKTPPDPSKKKKDSSDVGAPTKRTGPVPIYEVAPEF